MLKIWACCVLGLGMVVSAIILAGAVGDMRDDQIVFVRGLSEREVKADTVIWPISFQVSGEALEDVYKSYQNSANFVAMFLKQHGFEEQEWRITPPQVTDKDAHGYNAGKLARFVASGKVVVHTDKVDSVLISLPKTVVLLEKGVTLLPDYEGPEFKFTQLNSIKPDMLAEATRNGRAAAEKFAGDSGVRVGHLKTAAQGLFSILNRDAYTRHLKTVRVVTKMTYKLENK